MKPTITNYHTATAADLLAAGWRRWSADGDLYLCPESQLRLLPSGIALHSIGGAVKVKGRDYIDDATRGGMLAYGIIPGKTTTTRTAVEVATEEETRRAEMREQMAQMAQMARETGVFDLSTGRMLHGDEAGASIRSLSVEVPRG